MREESTRAKEWWAAGCARGWREAALVWVPRWRRTLVRERARHLLPERQQLDPRHVGRALDRTVVDEHGQALVRAAVEQPVEEGGEGEHVLLAGAELQVDEAAHEAHAAAAVDGGASRPRKFWSAPRRMFRRNEWQVWQVVWQ